MTAAPIEFTAKELGVIWAACDDAADDFRIEADRLHEDCFDHARFRGHQHRHRVIADKIAAYVAEAHPGERLSHVHLFDPQENQP